MHWQLLLTKYHWNHKRSQRTHLQHTLNLFVPLTLVKPFLAREEVALAGGIVDHVNVV